MLLAIDTSAGTAVAVVDRAGAILAERADAATRRHVEVVGDLLRAALAEAGIGASEITGVVAGMGPGPFTGLRVGIAAARAFAFGVGCPVVPVVSHDAVALGRAEPVVVATDARRRELAVSHYGPPDAGGLPARLAGPELVPAGPIEVPIGATLLEVSEIPAGALGALGARLLELGRRLGPGEPLYLRAPDVTLSAGPKRVTA
ncbi:MAG: tRNA (adenosine(37)-N6)-threonylcarbamoyltransferase complex dimerization subunit type 1 TsaB [Actinomycetales bacterium]|nr:tRNA (adenosine(37)-N6)-threonylcarbamoyltransferase complex dimerization subunit type 1 TsaB [Actinomycetales bacterium]